MPDGSREMPDRTSEPAPETRRMITAVESDPGAEEFPALAEAHRRGGRPDEAERVIRAGLRCRPDRTEARAVLCLVLLDQGRDDDARRELERVADDVLASAVLASDYSGEISESELDRAFAGAEAVAEQVIDADRLAQEAMRGIDSRVPDSFKTPTMARLLEEQGDLDGAARIRAALADERERTRARVKGNDPGEGLFPLDAPSHRKNRLRTLERWLEKVQE